MTIFSVFLVFLEGPIVCHIFRDLLTFSLFSEKVEFQNFITFCRNISKIVML